jgi:hypothetical protein
MPSKKKTPPDVPMTPPNTGTEPIPPGATTRAADRPLDPGGGPPGSAAGPRHAAADPGSPDEEYEATETNDPLLEPPPDDSEDGPPYAGPSGGAVGGTPAGKRSTGGHVTHGFNPGHSARGDSTIGAPLPEKK